MSDSQKIKKIKELLERVENLIKECKMALRGESVE